MTSSQITKRLVKNQISLVGLTIERDMIEVCEGYYENNGFGNCNERQTKSRSNKIKKLFPEYSYSSSTGYGAILIWFNFSKNPLISLNID